MDDALKAGMKIANDGLPIYEEVECWDCKGVGKVQRFEPCKNAGQTFRKGCPLCGKTRKADHSYFPKSELDTCYTCNGVGHYREGPTDFDKSGFWRTLPFRVYRSNRPQMMAEYLLGVGLCSVTDYGRHKALSDEQLIEKAKDIGSVQYCQYVSPDGKVAVAIGVFCNDNGYTVAAIWGDK